jgi:hypothetical protein
MFYNDSDVVSIKENSIWLYENFISKDQANAIVKVANGFSDDDWKDGWARHQSTLMYDIEKDSTVVSDWWSDKVSPPVLIEEMRYINDKLKPLFQPELFLLPEFKVVRLTSGQTMHKHIDDRSVNSEEGYASQSFKISCAYTLYLSDFTGGEINYPDLEYTHSPKIGDLIIHSGKTLHEVLPVKEGIRYTVTGWLIQK